ncbi:hypothetical protein N7G274_002245 [Stereocaulon virgatum]|uniref:Uncharacterized protein n=1 Tax=Stereocaulon virgatum TaxID=373712 RepID=A0ABR4AHC1_9LECA
MRVLPQYPNQKFPLSLAQSCLSNQTVQQGYIPRSLVPIFIMKFALTSIERILALVSLAQAVPFYPNTTAVILAPKEDPPFPTTITIPTTIPTEFPTTFTIPTTISIPTFTLLDVP